MVKEGETKRAMWTRVRRGRGRRRRAGTRVAAAGAGIDGA